MSGPEHFPVSNLQAAAQPVDCDYWQGLIDERTAAEFAGLSVRTLQSLRQRGGGAMFIRLSARCVRYRRIDIRHWADDHLKASTSES